MLDYKLVEAFGAVVEEGGFERAAGRLHITQSAVSQRIKQLEELFGQVILLRTTPPSPTEFGKKLLRLYSQVNRLEDDFLESCRQEVSEEYTSLAIGLNADTLATWFFQAVEPFLHHNRVVFDLMVDDQEETHRFLRDGKVLGCVSTRRMPMQGCSAAYLGDMRYGLYCAETFYHRWFAKGLTREAVSRAPMITFNRKDRLNLRFLENVTGLRPKKYTTFYVPSSEKFVDVISSGLAYGAMPEQQAEESLRRSLIRDLVPGHKERVPLYYHYWNLDSPLLQRLTKQILSGFQQLEGIACAARQGRTF